MGTWGHGIRQDDFVCDVIDAFENLLKAGKSLGEATRAVKSKFAAEIKDADDGPLFWIALADMQWTYGQLEPQVFNRVEKDFESGRSLIPWTEDQNGPSRRKVALQKFISKIAGPNPRPKKAPKIVVRAPKFQAGECLTIRLSNGQYGAALVLAADHSNVEYGKNLVGVLDYLSPERPTIEVFRKRKWLVLSHHSWNSEVDLGWYQSLNFRAAKDRIEVVGQVEIRDSDPKESNSYCGWGFLGEHVIMQRDWDSKGA